MPKRYDSFKYLLGLFDFGIDLTYRLTGVIFMETTSYDSFNFVSKKMESWSIR